MSLTLASTSPYRAELLARVGVEFATMAPKFDEATYESRFASMHDEQFATELAAAKARSLVGRVTTDWVLAADQIAVLAGPPRRLLHKPGTVEAAIAQLLSLAGRTHHLVTGIVLLDARTGALATRTDRVALTMRSFAADEARDYVMRYRPLDCVGSYRIEDAGICLMAAVSGADPTSIMGLPLLSVCELLRASGLLPR